jgi:heptosyltransferase-2
MSESDRILVRAPNWTGDLVMATPGFRALRAGRPGAQLALHVRASLAPLVAGAPWFDEVIPLESYGRGAAALAREALSLRRRRFDIGLCLPDSFSSALLLRAAGARCVVGHRTQARAVLLHLGIVPPVGLVAREEHVLGLVGALGCSARGGHLELFTTPAEEEQAERLLSEARIGAGDALVLLAPGASYGPAKHWGPESFARVGDALSADGLEVALVGAPDEVPLARRVAGAMRSPVLDLVGRLDLGSLKAVVRRARLLVCNDAGARHVAVAFGVPVVALFGPTSLEKTGRNLDRVTPLAAEGVACRPCYRRTCPIDHRCMTWIAPERVVEAARSALRSAA